jgi:transglutaminase-like putative cysteine protease
MRFLTSGALGLVIVQPAFAQYKPTYTLIKGLDVFDVKANGEFSQISERKFRVDTPQGIKDLGEQRIEYNEKLEELEIQEAYTLLPDGSRTDVPPDKMKRQDGNGGEEYGDGKVMVIIFPKVDVGSVLYFRSRSYQKTPYFPGHFFWSEYYSPHVTSENVEVQLVHAPEVKLLIDADRVQGGRVASQTGDAPGSVRYRFTYQQDKAYPPETGQSSITDFVPHLAFSTFSNYAEFAKAYQDRAKPMAAITPAIEALAKKLTAGANDDRTKVRKLYNWVSQNIRYVAVYVAEGGFVPHSAQSTLDNLYGDCKDHVTLLEALLAAVGIESTTALINSGDALRIPKLAIATPFNHAITYIPKLDLYLDSTSRFTPMGSLPMGDMDKPTLLTASGVIGKTPMTSWLKDYRHTKVKMTLQKDGSVVGTSTWVTRGVEEIATRSSQFNYKNREQQEIVSTILGQWQETGSGEFLENDPTNLDMPWSIATRFKLDPVVNIPGASAMPIPFGLVSGTLKRMASYKPADIRRFPALCYSRGFKDSITLTFPPVVKVDRIPPNVKSRNGDYFYSATYQLNGQRLKVNRTYAAKRGTHLCSGDDDKYWNAFTQDLRRDLREQVFLSK